MNSNKIGVIFAYGFLLFLAGMSFAIFQQNKIVGIAFGGAGCLFAALIINAMFPDDYITHIFTALGLCMICTALLGGIYPNKSLYLTMFVATGFLLVKIYLNFRSQEDS